MLIVFLLGGREERGRGNRRSICRDYVGLDFKFVFVKDDGREGVDGSGVMLSLHCFNVLGRKSAHHKCL